MNERLKFRVWNKEEKTYAVFPYGSFALSESGELFWIESNCDCSELNTEDYIVEQCTGLKDKNGKLVYEGDVLGGFYGSYVKWCDRCKSFELFFGDECAACNGDVLWAEVVEDDGKLEVIGDIHQNPELVK